MVDPEVFRKQIYCIEKSTCDIVGTFRRPHSVSAPVELFPLCPPGYAPGLHRRILTSHVFLHSAKSSLHQNRLIKLFSRAR